MTIDIYNDNISYLTDEVSTIPTAEANLNEANRIKFVTDLAAVSRGKDASNNPPIRYKALLKEAALHTPSRPMEFLPVVVDLYSNDYGVTLWITDTGTHPEHIVHKFDNLLDAQKLLKYSYLDTNPSNSYSSIYKCYTNMRALLNAGVPYENIPFNTPDELASFRAVKLKIPMFVFNHFVTHTALSKETLSDRVTLQSGEYWLPSDIKQRLGVSTRKTALQQLLGFPQPYSQYVLKQLGYKPEIYQRAMLEFRYKTTVATGWYNDPSVWQHFLIEREAYPDQHKSWVQPETKQLAISIKQLFGV